MPQPVVLASGEIFEITADGAVLTCRVENRPDVTPEAGARCAREMDAVLGRELLGVASRYRGLIFDVRRGPAAFGPKTRASLESLFGRAERLGRRVGVLVGQSATQYMQFSNLQRECAPEHMRVSRSEIEAGAWAAGFGE